MTDGDTQQSAWRRFTSFMRIALRDNEEANKLISKIEDAKTEKLLMEVGRADGETV